VATGVLEVAALDGLVAALWDRGYRVVGPRVRDGVIVYDDLARADQLPIGWTDTQVPGHYRLEQRGDAARFGYAVGPHSWKRELYPPRQRLWEAVSDGDATFHVVEPPQDDQALAFVGVRGCELAAIAVQDRVFLQGLTEDRVYAAHRRDNVLIAVECHSPAATCFCTSMGTGPAITVPVNGDAVEAADDPVPRSDAPAQAVADLVLTELLDGEPCYLARAGTALGEELLAELEHRPVTDTDTAARDASLAAVTDAIDRHLDVDGIRDLLMGNLSHPRWDDVADRCLTCGNCTMVCPTCFCSTVEDTTDLTGDHAARDRRWDSCFTLAFSHTGPASVRTSNRARYRQWMTHKLATWIDQFETSGCVGCGRCLTWCPVGIDITEEVAAIRATDGREVGT
jgi:sulfhydrogenase subunit beta (sulfur reductase)